MVPTWHIAALWSTQNTQLKRRQLSLRKMMSKQMHENRRIKGQNDPKDDNAVQSPRAYRTVISLSASPCGCKAVLLLKAST